jgi:hypothetical protein
MRKEMRTMAKKKQLPTLKQVTLMSLDEIEELIESELATNPALEMIEEPSFIEEGRDD